MACIRPSSWGLEGQLSRAACPGKAVFVRCAISTAHHIVQQLLANDKHCRAPTLSPLLLWVIILEFHTVAAARVRLPAEMIPRYSLIHGKRPFSISEVGVIG